MKERWGRGGLSVFVAPRCLQNTLRTSSQSSVLPPPFLRVNILIRGGGSTTLLFITHGITKHQSVRDLRLSMRTKWLKNECRVQKNQPNPHYLSKYPPQSPVLHCGNKSSTSGLVPRQFGDAILPATIRRM